VSGLDMRHGRRKKNIGIMEEWKIERMKKDVTGFALHVGTLRLFLKGGA
jgi:hypothetical protein